MKNNAKKWLYPLLFTLGGMLAGLGYYYAAGCASGACPITTNPVRAMIYTGIMAWLLSVVLRPERREEACEE